MAFRTNKNPAYDFERQAFSELSERERRSGFRSAFRRGQIVEANIHTPLLPHRSIDNLVDPQTGSFYFRPGLSRVGGDDIVRPD
jgi:hypothetical protein